MPAPTLEAQINDLLKFVFSEPRTPGKEAMMKQLGEDWRGVIRSHVKLTAQQAKAFDAFTPEEVAAMRTAMIGSIKAGKTPKVKVVTKAGAAVRPLAGVVARVAAKAPAKGEASTNNVNC